MDSKIDRQKDIRMDSKIDRQKAKYLHRQQQAHVQILKTTSNTHKMAEMLSSQSAILLIPLYLPARDTNEV